MTDIEAKDILKSVTNMLDKEFAIKYEEALNVVCNSLNKTNKEKYKYLAVYMAQNIVGSVKVEFPHLPTAENIKQVEENIKQQFNSYKDFVIINLIEIS